LDKDMKIELATIKDVPMFLLCSICSARLLVPCARNWIGRMLQS